MVSRPIAEKDKEREVHASRSCFALQDGFQDFPCVKGVHIPFVPIVLFWNLGIEKWIELPNIFALFYANLLRDCGISPLLCRIQNIKIDFMSFALRFG